MFERLKAYFEKLEALSIDELDRSAEKLIYLDADLAIKERALASLDFHGVVLS